MWTLIKNTFLIKNYKTLNKNRYIPICIPMTLRVTLQNLARCFLQGFALANGKYCPCFCWQMHTVCINSIHFWVKQEWQCFISGQIAKDSSPGYDWFITGFPFVIWAFRGITNLLKNVLVPLINFADCYQYGRCHWHDVLGLASFHGGLGKVFLQSKWHLDQKDNKCCHL